MRPKNFKKDHRDENGFVDLRSYAALGDGRTLALTACDGSIDWWCVPSIDSPPLFDRILDGEKGGFYLLRPVDAYRVKRRYRNNSNVLESVFETKTGQVRVTESLNSGPAGRLPWSELARRVDGLKGTVRMRLELVFGRRADTINPYFYRRGGYEVFVAERVTGVFVPSAGIKIEERSDAGIKASFVVKKGQREVAGLVLGEDEPLVVPPISSLNTRIDSSDKEWKDWAKNLSYEGEYEPLIIRNALVLKLLLFSSTGAIAAAGTSSLPEKIGGPKNYDYRYAWVRDAAYTIKAFLRIGALAESKAAFTWLLRRLDEERPKVCYTLNGKQVPDREEVGLEGYRGSRPVTFGNRAGRQLQLGIYGDIFETAARFVEKGGLLDGKSAETLSHLADYCAEQWRRKDSGIWELEDVQHYTNSKISCWQALARAVELADSKQLPTTCRDRWERERDRIKAWIEENCWSSKLNAYEFYPGSMKLDCSVALAARFGFDSRDRLRSTLRALDEKLRSGPFHHRYSGMKQKEGCFIACSFWIAEAWAILGQKAKARKAFGAVMNSLGAGVGVYSEMIDPNTLDFLGNMPQGLTHLALIQAAATIEGIRL